MEHIKCIQHTMLMVIKNFDMVLKLVVHRKFSYITQWSTLNQQKLTLFAE